MGIGVDVHRYATGQVMYLAGLLWPDEPAGLAGHSDGDAAAHACADALLAAAGLGDLGTVLGVGRAEHAGISGVDLLRHVADEVRAAGLSIGNVSVAVIGNRPTIAPRRAEAQAALSDAAGAPVTVTGTTTDGLGLTGRGEGVAAVATALVLATLSR